MDVSTTTKLANSMTLKNMNRGAAVLHFVLGAIIVVFFTMKDAWHNGDVPIHRVSAKRADESTRMFYEAETEEIGVLPNVALLLAICIVTSLAHVFYSMWGRYDGMTMAGTNPMRYAEYGVSATLMTLVIASFSGVRDVTGLLLLAVMTVVLMGLGAVVEKTASKGGTQSWPVLGGAWLLFAGVWAAIIYSFISTVSDSEEAPDWLPAIVFFEMGIFALFGLLSLAYVYKWNVFGNFATVEKGFLVLSFTAKAFLVLLLTSALATRPDPVEKEEGGGVAAGQRE